MDQSQKIPISPLSITAYTSKQAKKMKNLEEKEETRKTTDRVRWQSRVNLGVAFSRWRKLREEKGFKTDMELAIFLMDSYERGPSTSRKCKRPGSTSGPRKKRTRPASPPALCNRDGDLSGAGVQELEHHTDAEDMAMQELENSLDGSEGSDVSWYFKSGEDDESRSFEETTDEDDCPQLRVQIGGAPHSPTCKDSRGGTDKEHRSSTCKEEVPRECSPSLDQEHPVPPLKKEKEEEEELLISPVGELVNRLEEADTKDSLPPTLSGGNTVTSLHGPDQSQSQCPNQRVENGEGQSLASTSVQDVLQPSACKEEFSSSLGQQDPEPPMKKEKEEEPRISQVRDRLEDAATKYYILPMLTLSMANFHGQDQSQSLCPNPCVESGVGHLVASTSVQVAEQERAPPLSRQRAWRKQKAAREDEDLVARGEPPRKRLVQEHYHYTCKQCGEEKNKSTGHTQQKGRWYCPASGLTLDQWKSSLMGAAVSDPSKSDTA